MNKKIEVKICGITKSEEAAYLNEAQADYAGFVFFEKSRRNISIEQAKSIFPLLDKKIRKVAVTVSCDETLAEQIQQAGFDVLQVHKELKREVLENVRLPVWYACNIADSEALKEKQQFLAGLPDELSAKVEAILVDGAEYGSGKTFDWRKSRQLKDNLFAGKKLILAGGLNPLNVAEGIRLFKPDIVDVSSGVEGEHGKDRTLIQEFVGKVRAYE